ncbi:MAG: 3-phosphoshikimate 1-carboxyvinyltransferase [Planctomycetota bacterium]
MSRDALRIEPLELPFDFAPHLPGSKSCANRALVLSALANGATTIARIPDADDVRLLLRGLSALGFDVAMPGPTTDGRCVVVQGGLPRQSGAAAIDCGAGGTTLRFLLPLAACVRGDWTFDGDARLRERPIAELVTALRALGAEIDATRDGLPLRIRGGAMRGGSVRLDASKSSQFLSGLMLVAPALAGGLDVHIDGRLASASYVELTRAMLGDFGITVAASAERVTIAETQLASPGRYEIEADWSAAGAWLVLERLAKGRARMAELKPDSRQPDRRLTDALHENVGWNCAEDRRIDVSSLPDQLMNLAIYAAHCHGTTRFTGVENLRLKESDRLEVFARGCAAVGIDAVVERDALVVTGPAKLRPARIATARDHRMAMAFAIVGALSPGIEIEDPDCVAKSYPGFFADLERARHSARAIALIGVRLAGKTTLGAALAARLGLRSVDTDAVFVERHGAIAAFVERHGWPRFRGLEEAIVAESLVPQAVVALGGGAVESAATRTRLRSDAICVWVREDLAILRARAGQDARPSLTSRGAVDELEEVLARRAPYFRELADIELAPSRALAERVDECVGALRALCSWQQTSARRNGE